MGKNTNRNGLALGLIALGTVTLAGLGIYASNEQASPKPQSKIAAQSKPNIQVTPDEPEKGEVTELTPRLTQDDVKYDRSTSTPPPGVDPKVWAINQYLSKLDSIPAGTKVLSVTTKDKIATVDMSKETEAGFGSMDEMILVEGILKVMSQFKDINAVQFLVEGKKIESIGGHIDLSEPQPVIPMDGN